MTVRLVSETLGNGHDRPIDSDQAFESPVSAMWGATEEPIFEPENGT